MFKECSTLTSLDIRGFNINNLKQKAHLFDAMPDNAEVRVSDPTMQNWVLNLSSSARPAAWTTDNVIIATEGV